MTGRFATLLVGRPLDILIVALLLAAAAAWLVHAGREWLVMVRTPEANIRVDLLVIWPVLVVPSLWCVVRALRQVSQGARAHAGHW
jgi:hypothetical protein